MGWSLDRPRGRGGFSQYLVLAAIIVPADMNKFLERPVRNLYVRRGRSLGRELKSTALNGHERESFGRALAALPAKHAGLSLHAIVTEKCKVPSSLRGKPDVLYNHMAEQMLHQQICRWREVDIYPDARTIKARDRNGLHNHLETCIAVAGHDVIITTIPSESGRLREIQATDILASIVWAKYEEQDRLFDKALAQAVNLVKLF